MAQSLPLGAGRLTREWLHDDPPEEGAVRELRKKVRAEIARDAGAVLRGGTPDHAVATSKTFRSLARVCGAAPSRRGAARPPRAGRATCSPRSCDELVRDGRRRSGATLPGVSGSAPTSSWPARSWPTR